MLSSLSVDRRLTNALAALDEFNSELSKLTPPSGAEVQVFISSFYRFSKDIASGIAALACRMTDGLAERRPMEAHAIAAGVLEASVDEYGLDGSPPHTVMLLDFGAALGCSRAQILAGEDVEPSAAKLGDAMRRWYRDAPVAWALGIHLASELTSASQFPAWLRILGDRDDAAWEYLRIHAQVEVEHMGHAKSCLAIWLDEFPDDVGLVQQAIDEYGAMYAAMFHELAVQLAERQVAPTAVATA